MSRLSKRIRTWWALRLWERRRKRRTQVPSGPNAPVITVGEFEWDTTEVGYADVHIHWTFEHGTYPVAYLEVWLSVNAGEFALQGGVDSSTTMYAIAPATANEGGFDFKLRYRHGSTVGPFSNVKHIEVSIP